MDYREQPNALFEELRQLDDGTDASLERLVVSSRAHVLLDAHRVIDGMIEDEKRGRSTGSLGTTKRGVGPAYASKMNRNGLRFCDLVGPDDVLVDCAAFLLDHLVGEAAAVPELRAALTLTRGLGRPPFASSTNFTSGADANRQKAVRATLTRGGAINTR